MVNRKCTLIVIDRFFLYMTVSFLITQIRGEIVFWGPLGNPGSTGVTPGSTKITPGSIIVNWGNPGLPRVTWRSPGVTLGHQGPARARFQVILEAPDYMREI